MMLEAGVPVDAINLYGQTALYYAAERRNTAICEMLLDAGASAQFACDTVAGCVQDQPAIDWLNELLAARAAAAALERLMLDELFDGIKNATNIQ